MKFVKAVPLAADCAAHEQWFFRPVTAVDEKDYRILDEVTISDREFERFLNERAKAKAVNE